MRDVAILVPVGRVTAPNCQKDARQKLRPLLKPENETADYTFEDGCLIPGPTTRALVALAALGLLLRRRAE